MSRYCAFCQVVIPPERKDIYREAVGWVKPGRGMGGQSGSSIVLRKDTGAVAHAACIERAKQGLHPRQTSLTDPLEGM